MGDPFRGTHSLDRVLNLGYLEYWNHPIQGSIYDPIIPRQAKPLSNK